ncbi:MAG: ribonuclease P protein component [Terriglobales bacterium]
MAPPEVSRVPAAGGAPAGLSRQARLRKHADFDQVYRNGRRLFSAHMTVFFLRRNSGPPPQQTKTGFAGDPGPARVGFTVTRALGTAVERNRIRRRLREAVRLNLGMVGNAVDVVIHPKKSAQGAGFAELREEIARAFGRIRSSAKDGESVSSE